MSVIIKKAYVETPDDWEEITVEQAKDYLEERGYYKPGTVDEIIAAVERSGEDMLARTPWARYLFTQWETCKIPVCPDCGKQTLRPEYHECEAKR